MVERLPTQSPDQETPKINKKISEALQSYLLDRQLAINSGKEKAIENQYITKIRSFLAANGKKGETAFKMAIDSILDKYSDLDIDEDTLLGWVFGDKFVEEFVGVSGETIKPDYDLETGILKSWTYYNPDGEALVRGIRTEKGFRPEMLGEGDETLGSFPQEGMDPSKYFDKLAKFLNTPEKMEIFFELFINYQEEEGDVWQSAGEALKSCDSNGVMSVDCEEYSFIAREILIRQGKIPYVLAVPGHATCIWAEKVGGKYIGYTMGTFGFDKSEGHDSMQDAVNSLLEKFKEEGLGVETGIDHQIEDSEIEVADVLPNGEQVFTTMMAEALVEPNIADIYKQLLEAKGKGDIEGQKAVHLKLLEEFPNRKHTESRIFLMNYYSFPDKSTGFVNKNGLNEQFEVLKRFGKNFSTSNLLLMAGAFARINDQTKTLPLLDQAMDQLRKEKGQSVVEEVLKIFLDKEVKDGTLRAKIENRY